MNDGAMAGRLEIRKPKLKLKLKLKLEVEDEVVES